MFWTYLFPRGVLRRLAGHPFLGALAMPGGAAVAALRTFSDA